MIDNEILKRAAYTMVVAYEKERTLGDAVHKVAEQFPELDTSTGALRGMWYALAARADLES